MVFILTKREFSQSFESSQSVVEVFLGPFPGLFGLRRGSAAGKRVILITDWEIDQ